MSDKLPTTLRMTPHYRVSTAAMLGQPAQILYFGPDKEDAERILGTLHPMQEGKLEELYVGEPTDPTRGMDRGMDYMAVTALEEVLPRLDRRGTVSETLHSVAGAFEALSQVSGR